MDITASHLPGNQWFQLNQLRTVAICANCTALIQTPIHVSSLCDETSSGYTCLYSIEPVLPQRTDLVLQARAGLQGHVPDCKVKVPRMKQFLAWVQAISGHSMDLYEKIRDLFQLGFCRDFAFYTQGGHIAALYGSCILILDAKWY